MNWNKWMAFGQVSQFPELAYSKAGKPYARVTMRSEYRMHFGDSDPRTDVADLEFTLFGKDAEAFCARVQVGAHITAEGHFRTEEFQVKATGKTVRALKLACDRWETQGEPSLPPPVTPDTDQAQFRANF